MQTILNTLLKNNLDTVRSPLLSHHKPSYVCHFPTTKYDTPHLLKLTDDESVDQCVSCLSSKMTRKPFPHRTKKATDLLGLIHTDVCGLLRHVSIQCASYFMTFTDDYSRYGYVYLHKHEVFETFKVFKNEIENQLEKTIKVLQSDRGGEYINQEFKDYLKAYGIIQQLTPLYTPQYNGVSERRNRTLLVMVRGCEALGKRDTPIKLQQRSVKYAEFLEKNLISQEASGRAVELKKIQNDDTSLSKNTSKIPAEVEDTYQPPQEEIDLVRRSVRTHQAPERLCLNVEVDEHSLRDLNEPANCEPHWTAVKNILKYLRNTKYMFLVYDGNPEAELRVTCYCDAGFETDRHGIKSQIGYVFVLNRGAIIWKSSKQSATVMSATVAKYIVALEAAMEAIWIRTFISGLGIVPTINEPIKMLCDNLAALLIANEPWVQKGTRHYHRRYHYVREYIELGEINLLKVHTDNNLEDPFTKALLKGKLTQHARRNGLRLASSFM
nr:putative retrotransposon protein [Tanacetum cinerariifolium]